MSDIKSEIEQILCRACEEHDCEYGHCYLKLEVTENVLALPVGGEVDEYCEIYKTSTDIYKDCSHCEHLKEDQNEWYCGVGGVITRPRAIADCEEE